MEIRSFTPEDYSAVQEIYQHGIETQNATFEVVAPTWEEWDKKFLKPFRLIATIDHTVMGWAALSQVSPRKVYAGVCEVTLYIHPHHQSKGIGKQLLSELIRISEQGNIWTLQAGIFPENVASIKLHKNLGFREVGYRERIGKMGGTWRDTILLERRSKIAGID